MDNNVKFKAAIHGLMCGSILGSARQAKGKSERELYSNWEEKWSYKKYKIQIQHSSSEYSNLMGFLYLLKVSTNDLYPESWFIRSGVDLYFSNFDYRKYITYELENVVTRDLDYSSVSKLLSFWPLIKFQGKVDSELYVPYVLSIYDNLISGKLIHEQKNAKKVKKLQERSQFIFSVLMLLESCSYLENLKDRLEYGGLVYFLCNKFSNSSNKFSYLVPEIEYENTATVVKEILNILKESMNSQGNDNFIDVITDLKLKLKRSSTGLLEVILAVYLFSIDAAYAPDAVKSAANLNRHFKNAEFDTELIAGYVGLFNGFMQGEDWMPLDWVLDGDREKIYNFVVNNNIKSQETHAELRSFKEDNPKDIRICGEILDSKVKDKFKRIVKEICYFEYADVNGFKFPRFKLIDPMPKTLDL